LNDDNFNEIFDNEYNKSIIENLNMIWENAEKKMLDEMEKIQNEIERYMEQLMEEKLNKTLEINQKYENELRELEVDLDPSNLNIYLIIFLKSILNTS